MHIRLRRTLAGTRPWALALAVIGCLAGEAAAQGSAGQYAAAIEEQRAAIASNRAAQARCGASNDPTCAAVAARGAAMQQNLARLQNQYARLGGSPAQIAPAAPVQDTRRTTVFVNGQPVGPVANGNRWGPPPGVGPGWGPARPAPPRPVAQPTQPEPRNFFTMLFGGGGSSSSSSGGGYSEATVGGETTSDGTGQPGDGWGGGYGGMKTLCVRTCDGYYFPIAFNSSSSRLKTEAGICKSLCPAAETRLYYHWQGGQEAEQAVAADTGEPITKLPNAFLYRTKVVQGCTCGKPDPRFLPAILGGQLGAKGGMSRAFDSNDLPLPRARPMPDQDPETVALQVAGFEPVPVQPLSMARNTEAHEVLATTLEPPKVRTVGPKYFSDR